ncbi:AAA family ATPase [Polaribacter sp. AHE13PA]|jgi:predicted ATPase|uniref:AAA family ATPase n=1 Tax=Polaribacter sp. AHE13PA TaxID=2745562 RepID=UPI001C4EA695|nr:AAA family ATPase [Polaribacter sp. AHE13PA]QXP65766.1 AAA family ATPase [Polaribacter sp. AHE13PA]
MIEIGIKEIKVNKLFGHYTYNLPKEPETKELNKLFILYGDNGAGKTTVLNLVFYLLSTKDKSGFKTKLAQTKFKLFSIKLSNGIEIGASRKDSVLGSYTYYIKKNNRYIHRVELEVLSNNIIRLESGTPENLDFLNLLEYIKNLNISIYFLSEDRKILSSKNSTDNDDDDDIDFRINTSNIDFSRNYERIRTKKILNENRLSLELTVERFIDWIRKQVIQSSKIGETNTLYIYSELVKNIDKPKEKIPPLTQLLKKLDSLEKKSEEFTKIGLIDKLDFKEFKKSINSISIENKKALPSIIQLFVNSTNARLNALEGLYEVLNDFIIAINKFYTNKSLSFNLSKGFSIKHTSGESLHLEMLSSGEKQLLLLFINTITATDQATIFIIDEPEISLNIKWQRMLLKTLLKFSSKNFVQFIIATHSIELLAPNSHNVVKLEE